jgi:hypothetical protein
MLVAESFLYLRVVKIAVQSVFRAWLYDRQLLVHDSFCVFYSGSGRGECLFTKRHTPTNAWARVCYMGQVFTAAECKVMVSAIPKAGSPTWRIAGTAPVR